jgi:hypothetical protein
VNWTIAMAAALLLAIADPTIALARSSGGYSRPSLGGSYHYSAPRRPPSSGGYSRSLSAPSFGGSSAGDQAVSRGMSSEALRAYRRSQEQAAQPARRPSPWEGSAASQWNRRPPPSGWAQGGSSSFTGSRVLDAVGLWALFNAIGSAGRANYFYEHQNDPAYRAWRQQAEAEAAKDPAVASRLNNLDQQMAQVQEKQGPPPPAPSSRTGPGSGGVILWIVIIVGGIAFLYLWYRRRKGPGRGMTIAAPAGARRFRVGMTFPVDPAPFLLASGSTKVQPPKETGLISVEAVGALRLDGVPLSRLYLPGRAAFFQIHLGPDGAPDECRYFSRLDEVSPADQNEWGLWLDPTQGMIGWPAFQTKDGQTYGRAWAPGDRKVPPRQIAETIQALGGTEQRRLQSMLYGRQTGAAAPAPQVEYILVSAVEAGNQATGNQAWVEIHAGIDVNPAAISLPAVPLSSPERSAA